MKSGKWIFSREKKIDILTKIVLTGFILSCLYLLIVSINQNKYPYNTFLFNPLYRFSDFINFYNTGINFNPYLGGPPSDIRNVFPFPYFLGHLIVNLEIKTAIGWFIFLFALFMFYTVRSNLSEEKNQANLKDVFILAFLTYPVLFSIDRLNLEIIIFIATYFAVRFFKNRKFILSALCLSVAIAFKAIPAVFLLLYINERKYKEVIISLVVAVIFTVGPLYLFPGGVIDNFNRFIPNAAIYKETYVIGYSGLAFGHSLWGLVKIISNRFTAPNDLIFSSLYNSYTVISLFLMLLIVIYVLKVEKVFWEKTGILVLSMLLFSPVSADYKLLHMYIPLFLFINSKEHTKFDLFYLVLFSLIFIPKNYFHQNASDVNLGVVLNPLILLCMMMGIIREGIYG